MSRLVWISGILIGLVGLVLPQTTHQSEATTACPAGLISKIINYGDNVACSLDAATEGEEVDFFSFNGAEGERVYVRAARGPATLISLEARILDPNNNSLCSDETGAYSDVVCLLVNTGTHTIKVSAPVGGSGPYVLYLQRLSTPGPVGATTLVFGENHASVLTAGYVEDFTFSVTSGDPVFVRMAQSDPPVPGDVDPEFLIFRSDGAAVSDGSGDCARSNGRDAWNKCLVDGLGPYTILAFDRNGNGTGNYVLFLQTLVNPGTAASAPAFGQNSAGTLAAGYVEDFTFSGTSDDVVFFRIAQASISATFDPEIHMYDPDGGSDCDESGGFFARIQWCGPVSAGANTILAFDQGGYGSGAYSIYGQSGANPVNATPLAYSPTTISDSLTAGEVKAYTFTGELGDVISVEVTKLSGSLTPEFEVFSVTDTYCVAFGANTASTECELAGGGIHVIVVYDHRGYGEGSYGVTLLCLGGICSSNAAPTVSLTVDATANEGQTKTYNFSVTDEAGDSFTAAAGYPNCGTGGSLVVTSFTTSPTGGSFQCFFPDGPATSTVSMQVKDSANAPSNVGSLAVTVNNLEPTIAISGAPSVGEGALYSLTLGAVTDPGSDTVSSYVVHWGDGNTDAYGSNGVKTHPYADGLNSYNITVDLVDEDGTHLDQANPLGVTVNNVEPTIAISGAPSIGEGAPYSLTLGAVTDSGSDTVSSYVVHWGDGNTDAYGSNGIKPHPYGDGLNSYNITVDLVDEDGTHLDRANALSVTVNNVEPTIVISGAPSVGEGAPYSLTLGAVTDPGADTVTSHVVHWGDGNTDVYSSNGVKPHSYADGPNSYNITVDLVDEDGTHLDQANGLSVTVNNVQPTVDAGPDAAIKRGSTFSKAGSFTEPGADTWTATVNYGDGSGSQPLGLNAAKTFSLSHVYANYGTYTATVTVTDDDGGQGSDTLVLVVPVAETTPPSCVLTATTKGPPAKIEVTAQDTGSGIAIIKVLKAINVNVSIPTFALGSTSPVVVTATKINQTQSSTVQLEVKDVAGNKTLCDPVITLVVREEGEPAAQTFTGLPQAESKVKIANGNPGLTKLNITVNGKKFKEKHLQDNEMYTLDVSSAMVPGDNNIIILEAQGKPGGSALVVISD